MAHTNKLFRGEKFHNRIRIEYSLVARSSFHLGAGETMKDPNRLPLSKKQENEEGMKEPPDFTLVTSDANGIPFIPGSSLKGALHGYLQRLFSHLDLENGGLADVYEDGHYHPKSEEESRAWQDDEIAKSRLTWLHLLFGSPRAAGKVDFWDAACTTKEHPQVSQDVSSRLLHWDPKRRTIILKSVAIDPVRGTAADKKLYNFEVVPAGAQFHGSIVGQNLSDLEMGMLLFVLGAFNSEIYLVTLGAMSGRGFGRFTCTIDSIHVLQRDQLTDWVKASLEDDRAGFAGLAENSRLSQETHRGDEFIRAFKSAFVSSLEV